MDFAQKNLFLQCNFCKITLFSIIVTVTSLQYVKVMASEIRSEEIRLKGTERLLLGLYGCGTTLRNSSLLQ